VSPNATTAGAASIDLNIPNGTGNYSFWVQGVEGTTGTVTVTATASGFLDGVASMTVVQPGVILASLPSSLASAAANAALSAYVGVPSGSTVSVQNVRAGSPGVVVTVTSSNVGAAQLVTQSTSGASVTATIAPERYYTPSTLATGGLYIDPVAAGQTTIGVTALGFIAQPLATQTVTITP